MRLLVSCHWNEKFIHNRQLDPCLNVLKIPRMYRRFSSLLFRMNWWRKKEKILSKHNARIGIKSKGLACKRWLLNSNECWLICKIYTWTRESKSIEPKGVYLRIGNQNAIKMRAVAVIAHLYLGILTTIILKILIQMKQIRVKILNLWNNLSWVVVKIWLISKLGERRRWPRIQVKGKAHKPKDPLPHQ